MCGITGYINRNEKPLSNTHTIIKMLQVQKHRGPDDSGIRAFNLKNKESIELSTHKEVEVESRFNGLLGFNRLSILDLSYNGHQPMASSDGKVILTLNGEIYNAFDFKSELIQWGFHFKSTSDTEIVLALYLRYGIEGLLTRINGMFAIIIADLEKSTLYVARDRYGIKPMYYISNDKIFAFSSELKSFKHIENFTFELEDDQLDEYLLFRNNLYGTLYKSIQSLEPGHLLIYQEEQDLVKKQFFNINNYKRAKKESDDLDLYENKVEQWLAKSVKSQLISDVKLGCQLSGGIDSSLVTWLANNKSHKGSVEAVSIILNDPKYSEEKYINQVAENLGILSHKFLLDSKYYIENIEKATWHLELPINHPNTIGIYRLSQLAKEYVTVLLSGEGADEVFGGYQRFYDIVYPFRMRKILREIKKCRNDPFNLVQYLDADYRAIMATSFMKSDMAKKLYPEFHRKKAFHNREQLYQSLSGSLFDRQVKYEMITYLPDLLVRQDKMSMAHTIENRVPFLDNEVVENSFLIPEEYLLIKKNQTIYNTEKYLLKKIIARNFGNDFAFRNKMGFGIPLREFFSNDEFNEYLNDKILPNIIKRGLFNNKMLKCWISDIQGLNHQELDALWVIVSFEIWANLYLDIN